MSKIPTNDPKRIQWRDPNRKHYGTFGSEVATHTQRVLLIDWEDDWPDPSEVPQRGTPVPDAPGWTVLSGVPVLHPSGDWHVTIAKSGHQGGATITEFHVEPEPEMYSMEEIQRAVLEGDDLLARLRKNRGE